MLIVDAHEDIAWNMLDFGRDYSQSVAHIRAKEAANPVPEVAGETLLGWPEWRIGQVGVVFATLFANPACHNQTALSSKGYRTAEEAHHLCQAQLQAYQRLVLEHPDKFYLIKNKADLAMGLKQWHTQPKQRRVGLVLLMEGADAIREPAEVAAWFEAGVRLVGPAWAKTRYAGGTGDPGPLTPAGRDLLRAMAEVGMVLDLSHMTDEGVLEALDSYPGPLIASHSNTRSLVPTTCPERHLTDDMARRIADRQGVIGVMLFNCYLKEGLKLGGPRQMVTMAEVTAHIDHYCQVVGHTRHIGLGSDFDGGFGLADVPTDFDTIADLGKIGPALAQRGYAPVDIKGIMGGNWLNVLQRTLPEDVPSDIEA